MFSVLQEKCKNIRCMDLISVKEIADVIDRARLTGTEGIVRSIDFAVFLNLILRKNPGL